MKVLKINSRGRRFGIFFTAKKYAKFDRECQRGSRFVLNGILVLTPWMGATCDSSRHALRTRTLVYWLNKLGTLTRKKDINMKILRFLSDQVRVLQEEGKRPRKRLNDMYEPHIPLKNLTDLRSAENDRRVNLVRSVRHIYAGVVFKSLYFIFCPSNVGYGVNFWWCFWCWVKSGLPWIDACVTRNKETRKVRRARPCGRSVICKGVLLRKISSIFTVHLIRFIFKIKIREVIFWSAITPRWPDNRSLIIHDHVRCE